MVGRKKSTKSNINRREQKNRHNILQTSQSNEYSTNKHTHARVALDAFLWMLPFLFNTNQGDCPHAPVHIAYKYVYIIIIFEERTIICTAMCAVLNSNKLFARSLSRISDRTPKILLHIE